MSLITSMENLKTIFTQGYKAVQAFTLINNNRDLKNIIEESLDSYIGKKGHKCKCSKKRYHVIGFGKAVLGMAVQLERILENRLVSGIISIPVGSRKAFKSTPNMQLTLNTMISIIEGAANNLPDSRSEYATKTIKTFVESLTSNDILFVLISGGGSALLTLPKEPFTLEKKLTIIRDLTSQGAGIKELNIVRISLSLIKGGKLAKAAENAGKVISLVISDIVNDPIDLIASGPTVEYDVKNNRKAKEILEQYNIWETLEKDEQTAIESEETFKLQNTSTYIIANNKMAVQGCFRESLQSGYAPYILSTTIEGNVEKITKNYEDFLLKLYNFRKGKIDADTFRKSFLFNKDLFEDFCEWTKCVDERNKSMLLIMSGESTVTLTGNGKGGRNQELALRMSLALYLNKELQNICFLSAGTDGIDGPTTAAGAIGCATVIEDFLKFNPSVDFVRNFILKNDSFSFYDMIEKGKYHIITGHTGTNVMDIHLFLIHPEKSELPDETTLN